MAEGTVGILNVEFHADLSNLDAGFASAKMQSQNFSGQAGESFSNIGNEATKAGVDVAGLGDESKKTGEKVSGAGKQGADGIGLIGDALIAIGAVTAFKKIYDGFKQCIDASVEFESAMAGVAKTTDLTDAELSAMGESIKKMSTEIPATTTEIAGVAEAAGQLGIAKDDLLDFTETMTKLGTATNMTADEGATMLAQFANITQMPTDEYSNLGSTIVALGNSTATTESKITEMSQGMAASATNAGISESAILAMAAATASVGIEADAGSTSWSKFIQEMQSAVETGEDLDQWATVANMSASEFAKLWGQDAAQAINVWIQGLGSAAEQGQSMTGILEGLNITEVRQTRMLQSLANSGDLLTNALATGNQAWNENTALQKEAATRYATTESKAKMLENRQQNLAATVGDQLNPLYSNLIDIGTDVTKFFQEMFDENELLAPALAATAAGLGVVTFGTIAYSAAQKIKAKADGEATIAQMILNAVMNANPVFLIITGVTALTAALSVFALSLAEADAETQKINADTESLIDSMEGTVNAVDENTAKMTAQAGQAQMLVNKLDELQSKTNLTKSEQLQMQSAVGKLNEIYPDLGAAVEFTANAEGEMSAKLNQGTDAMRANVTAMQERLKAQAKEETLLQLYKDQADAEMQLATIDAKREGILMGLDETQRKYAQGLADSWDVSANLTMATAGLTKEQRDSIESLDELTKSEKELKETLKETNSAVAVMEERVGSEMLAEQELVLTTQELNDRYAKMQGKLSELGITADDYIAATQGMTEAGVAEYDQSLVLGGQYDSLLEKYGTLGITRQEYIDQSVSMTEAELNEYNQMLLNDAAMATMSTRYQELKDSALDSLQSQFDAWDMVDNSIVTSAQSIADALASQNTSYDNYAANIELAMARGFTASELMALGMGEYSEESAAAIAGLAAATDDEVNSIKANLESAPDSSGKLSGAFADMAIAAGEELDKTNIATQDAKDKTEQNFNAIQGKYEETTGVVETETDNIVAETEKMTDGVITAVENLNANMPEITFKVNQDIPLPHFSMSGNFNAQTGGVPTFGVNWYDTGGIFTTPQVIGIAEKRPEFVGATADLEAFINSAINRAFVDIPMPATGAYGGDINISMPITVKGKMTDAEIRRMTDQMVYTVRKKVGRLMN